MKKIFALMLVMMMLAVGLSACSNKTTTTTTPTEIPMATAEATPVIATDPTVEPAATDTEVLIPAATAGTATGDVNSAN